MSKLAAILVTLAVTLVLTTMASAKGPSAYTLTFVSANGPPIPGPGNELGETAYFTVVRSRGWLNKPNLYQRVQLVTSCDPTTSVVGTLRPGGVVWVSLQPVSIYGDYWGTNCKAWVSLDFPNVDSNVVTFVG